MLRLLPFLPRQAYREGSKRLVLLAVGGLLTRGGRGELEALLVHVIEELGNGSAPRRPAPVEVVGDLGIADRLDGLGQLVEIFARLDVLRWRQVFGDGREHFVQRLR